MVGSGKGCDVKLKSILGNINAQYANSHVDLHSKLRSFSFTACLRTPFALAARVGMVHYISSFNIGRHDNSLAACLRNRVARPAETRHMMGQGQDQDQLTV